MSDIVDSQTRSRMMSNIRSRNTNPEIIVRKGLHKLGFRFRLHSSKLPGTPDIVLSKYRVAIFVHGCFWHGHDCRLFKLPSTRPNFWREKIQQNIKRDQSVQTALHASGWRILTVWECAIKGKKNADLKIIFEEIGRWIISDEMVSVIEGVK